MATFPSVNLLVKQIERELICRYKSLVGTKLAVQELERGMGNSCQGRNKGVSL